MECLDSLQVRRKLDVGGRSYEYFSLDVALQKLGLSSLRLPFVLRILFENLLRNEDGKCTTSEDLRRFSECLNTGRECEINFMPARVMMQDFTGVPALVDLAAMRDRLQIMGLDPGLVNPRIPVDLIIDHSVQVDFYGTSDALEKNVSLEMSRNLERYKLLKWGQAAFKNLRVVPPGTGICHQVNLEYLAKVVWNNGEVLYPDTVVGTDSHTTMINGVSVLGWGVGGIEAEAAILGQPIVMVVPKVLGFKVQGRLREGVTSTDMVLTITNILREKQVVGKFVEFYGEGLKSLSVYERATIANMAPEYGATCGFFPCDQSTLNYLDITGRSRESIEIVEAYMKAQGLWYREEEMSYSETLEIDLADIQPVVAGPKRPQDKVFVSEIAKTLPISGVENTTLPVKNGDVVIASITSCTNTSNPYVMIAAGIVARKARKLGLKPQRWVKTSLAPGSRVVEEYLKRSELLEDLDALGFNIVGYGCTTCIGNSGPLAAEIEHCIRENELLVVSVLSGNRNFEGRIHPSVKANFLASPPLVLIYALAGTALLDITKDPISKTADGRDVFLCDLWPTNSEINEYVNKFIDREMFTRKYSDVFGGDIRWKDIELEGGLTYDWSPESTYVQSPTYLEPISERESSKFEVSDARILMLLGDSITTDHISPAGNISKDSPAGKFLIHNGVQEEDFNSYGARRGNHNVMLRGTFANVRIRNTMLPGIEGGFTKYMPTQEVMSIFDAAKHYKREGVPLVVIAGKEYGTGSSRDWAAKGTLLLGVKAVVAESFERIHRSNLIGMGVLPLLFKSGEKYEFQGDEVLTLSGEVGIKQEVECEIRRGDGSKVVIPLICAVNTLVEAEYMSSGGVLRYVLKRIAS